MGVDVGVVRIAFAAGVVGNVLKLVGVVFGARDVMGVIAVLPDFARGLLACGEGETTFDERDAALDGVVGCGSDEDVDVVGHDDEGVKEEAVL